MNFLVLTLSMFLRGFIYLATLFQKIKQIDRIRRFMKYIIHLITGKCELERICLNYDDGEFRPTYLKITNSLEKSKCNFFRDLRTHSWPPDIEGISESIITVIKLYLYDLYAKNYILELIEFEMHKEFDYNDRICNELFLEIWGTFFDTDCPKIPDPSWKLLGYQNSDPCLDFRGYGFLALHSFFYACCVNDICNNNCWMGPDNNPMVIAYKSTLNCKVNFSFAIQFIKIINLTHQLVQKDVLVEQFHRMKFTSPPSINFFYSLAKKIFIFYCSIWDNISTIHSSDKCINKIIKNKLLHQLKKNPDFI
ncbi:hypothetical protein HZS_996 [Henneguya salminicola]|nr:hypothetical protein HZS_996 [Henneguya salminicola]